MERGQGQEGAAVVEFVLVSVLLLTMFLIVFQIGVVLHVRNVLIASAAEGARYGAAADRSADEGTVRAKQAIAQALGQGTADSMTCIALPGSAIDGAPEVDIRCSGPLPLVFLPAGPLSITVHGHALEESR